jgi:excisionase family DNA binding protein
LQNNLVEQTCERFLGRSGIAFNVVENAFGVRCSSFIRLADKLLSLRFKPTLCYLNQTCRRRAMTAEPWVSVDQIAEHLGVTRDSIYRWIDRKGLPAHRVGRLWKFQVSDVDEWVRAGGADEAEKDGR